MTTTKVKNTFVKKVYSAQERLRGVAIKTPLKRDTILSEKLQCDVYFKQENLQEIRSYKIRGAYNLMSQLQKKKGQSEVVEHWTGGIVSEKQTHHYLKSCTAR